MFSRHNVTFATGAGTLDSLRHPGNLRRWRGVRMAFCAMMFMGLVACQEDQPAVTPAAQIVPTVVPTAALPDAGALAATPEPTVAAAATATAVAPTPTPSEPLAALVNDEPIFLVDYEKELARYEQAHLDLGRQPPPNYRMVVLDSLIERLLIVQAAASQGIVVTAEQVEAKLNEMRAEVDSEENFMAWLEANQFTESEFREALQTEMVTTRILDQVTADVPLAVEQVHARYLQVNDPALAATLLEQIRGGTDFGLLATQYSRDQLTAQVQGDLGFFARGSLLVPAVEEAAFALQPGEVSDVIAVTAGDGSTTAYLVQVIEKDLQRPLTAKLRNNLLEQTFAAWVETQWLQAAVERFVNTDA